MSREAPAGPSAAPTSLKRGQRGRRWDGRNHGDGRYST